jgi:hypothetical protein
VVEKPKGNSQLGKKLRWEDNSKINSRDIVCGYVDWIDLAQDRDQWRPFVNTLMNLRVL